jgi:hypothetical protein
VQRASIESNLLAAAQLWGEHSDAEASLEITFRVDRNANAGRGSGNSVTTVIAGEYDGNVVYEQGMAYELRTGHDPNGNEADVAIVLHPDYMATLWFDPQPGQRTAPVPADRLDAMSVFLHELGHALVFNGWLDPATGDPEGRALSTYARHVIDDGRNLYFVGIQAMRVHGGPVRLGRTHNNYHHVGDLPEGPDAGLADDLMNGIVFEHGRRYAISDLDLAILADTEATAK